MIELVHTGVSYAIAKAAETNLQILLGVDEPNGHVFLNRQTGGNILGGRSLVDTYDVVVVFVERQDNPVVRTHSVCSVHGLYNAH